MLEEWAQVLLEKMEGLGQVWLELWLEVWLLSGDMEYLQWRLLEEKE